MALFLRFFDAEHVLFSGANKSALGIHSPADGVFLQLPPAAAQAGGELVQAFCAHRPIRKACDLARPI